MRNDIDSPHANDNRDYNFLLYKDELRDEYFIIERYVEANTNVIDLGCGNGSLLTLLKERKNITETGIEISDSGVEVCREKGLNVQKGRIDATLPFKDNSFDISICNVTIQMVMYPEVLIKEMKRISKKMIISFPNFAFYKNRIDLLLKGRMPKPMLFNYKWYSTGHIHQLSQRDFKELVADIGGLKIQNVFSEPSADSFKHYLMEKFPNLFQVLLIYLLEKNESD